MESNYTGPLKALKGIIQLTLADLERDAAGELSVSGIIFNNCNYEYVNHFCRTIGSVLH